MNLLNLNFSQEIKKSTKKFREYNLFHKIMTFFWLIGPFIYLIERSPADIWLTLISIIFLIRSIVLKDWMDKYFWQMYINFWIICIISSFCPYLTILFQELFLDYFYMLLQLNIVSKR